MAALAGTNRFEDDRFQRIHDLIFEHAGLTSPRGWCIMRLAKTNCLVILHRGEIV